MNPSIEAPALDSIAPSVWASEHDVFMPGRIHFRSRMTAVRLANGSLALISPMPIDAALANQLSLHGPVEHLIAPSLFHHLYLGGAREVFPGARLHGPPGLANKRPDLRIDSTLGNSDAAPIGQGLEYVLVDGAPAAGEVCLFHPESRTLVVSDMVFNIHEYRGLLTGLVLRAVGAHRRLAPSRMWQRFAKDRAQVRASLTRVLRWDFERLVVGHGRVVERDAHAELERALSPLLR